MCAMLMVRVEENNDPKSPFVLWSLLMIPLQIIRA